MKMHWVKEKKNRFMNDWKWKGENCFTRKKLHSWTLVENIDIQFWSHLTEKKIIMNKLVAKLASAGSVALMGYEIGVHTSDEDNESKITKVDVNKVHNNEVIYVAIIVLICVFVAILAKMYAKMRQVARIV